MELNKEGRKDLKRIKGRIEKLQRFLNRKEERNLDKIRRQERQTKLEERQLLKEAKIQERSISNG